MKNTFITKSHARRVLLTHQGLWPPYSLQGKSGVLEYIRRVGCIQFDPLNIVSRSPELVLQARLSDFRPWMLDELLYQDRQLLDGLDKNMAIYHLEDWPYFQRRRKAARLRAGKSHAAVEAILPQVRKAIENRGPLSSLELDFGQTVDWAWAPTRVARAALESMYFWGELVIHHKVNTRKVYDFACNHLPPELLSAPDPHPKDEQYHDWYVHRRIGGIGLLWNRSGDAWLGMSGIKSKERSAALTRLLETEKIIQVNVEGIDVPFYMRSEDLPCLEETQSDPVPQAAILAPLDNLLWDRRLVRELFDFDYRWEVYKPVSERRYGYYVLPVLYGDRFIARFEPGRDKRNGILAIKNWWWEQDVTLSKSMKSELQRCFKRFLDYLGAGCLQIDPRTAEREGLEWLQVKT